MLSCRGDVDVHLLLREFIPAYRLCQQKKSGPLRPLFFCRARTFRQGTNAVSTGLSEAAPNAMICVPAVERWMYHVAADDLNTTASVLPSPS
jgi:hypothetical protein